LEAGPNACRSSIPAGLATAVYAASEGLSVIVFDARAYGGQAGESARIENYLGFPARISGRALAGRAFVQAQKFGAEMAIPIEVAARSAKARQLWHNCTLIWKRKTLWKRNVFRGTTCFPGGTR
jgi:thioredoxin reductase